MNYAYAAQELAGKGRHGDTMLVHMSPQEVGGLQALARNHGTTLTVNPHTGYPEAFNIGKLLPLAAGVGLSMTGMSPLAIGLLMGGLGAATSGSLIKGALTGLSAYGGASMAGSLANLAAPAAAAGATGAAGTAAIPYGEPMLASDMASSFGGTQANIATPGVANYANVPGDFGQSLGTELGMQPNRMFVPGVEAPQLVSTPNTLSMTAGTPTNLVAPAQATIPYGEPVGTEAVRALPAGTQAQTSSNLITPSRVVSGIGEVLTDSEKAKQFAKENTMSLLGAGASMLMPDEKKAAASGVPTYTGTIRPYEMEVTNLSTAPISPEGQEAERLRYRYIAQPTYAAAQGGIIDYADGGALDDKEYVPYQMQGGIGRLNTMRPMPGYAKGGELRPTRKVLSRMDEPYDFASYGASSRRPMTESVMKNFADGGLSNVPRFLSGGGDGMSDSIPATINNRQPARLADGEFVVPADVVSHIGNGSSKAGAKQLYAMMDRVRAQRTGKKKQAPAINPSDLMPA